MQSTSVQFHHVLKVMHVIFMTLVHEPKGILESSTVSSLNRPLLDQDETLEFFMFKQNRSCCRSQTKIERNILISAWVYLIRIYHAMWIFDYSFYLFI